MRADTSCGRRIWLVSGGVGTALVVGVLALFQAPAGLPPLRSEVVRTVELRQVTGAPNVLNEETLLRDLAPLFLPTDRNAVLQSPPAREPGRTFLDVEAPKFGIADRAWQFDRALPPLVTLNGKSLAQAGPLDYLHSVGDEFSLSGLGRASAPLPEVGARGATIEVVRLRDGSVLLSQPVPLENRPPTDKLWLPLELVANVGPSGLVAPLALNQRSGVDEVDSHFRTFLSKTFQVGERLPPGFYRIRVSP